MNPSKTYSLPCLLVLLGSCMLGLYACSSNVKLGNDNDPNSTVGGAASTGGSRNSTPTGGSTSTNTTAATGGARTLKQLPKACPGLPIATTAVDAGAPIDADAGELCAGADVELESSLLDMFIMMDRTTSMTYAVQNTSLIRWDVLQQGVQQFVNSPAVIAKAPRVGLGFFSKTGNPNDPSECDPNAYAQPLIEMEPIVTGGPILQKAVIDERALLGGQTAWLPALQGALMHAQDWQSQTANLNRMTVVVLVTDGYPTECDTDMSHITEAVGEYYAGFQGAYNGRGLPSIRTYVVGVAVDRFNLDAVAQSGGTGSATIVDGVGSVGAVDQFVNAMVNITSSDIKCDIAFTKLNSNLVIDPEKVQVVYETFQGEKQEFPRADSAAGCTGANGGWYFDNPMNPKIITLCPCTCANLGAGRVKVRLGCKPPVVIG